MTQWRGVEALPMELWLEIAAAMGPDATVRDWLGMSLLCHRWQNVFPKMFAKWLDVQAASTPFGHFPGNATELSFIRLYIDIIVSKDISVTCRVAPQGMVQWWLTQESGQSPVCKNNRCSRCKPVQQARELKRAYLVLVLDHPGELVWAEPLRRIALAKLSVDALDIASHTIMPTVLEKSTNRRLPVVRSLFRLFRHGLFSSSLGCGCSVDLGVCKTCAKCEQVRFIWENGFSRVFPCGKDHWFRGVTDAVDQTFAENRWLRCSSICLEDHPELI
ncbi:hypothetical protein IQ07DRAFT_606524 [Pyrenochaeta sp. DS3sAY3a]|nr:hypothetical protein IQ07DRAFT_606524 [Pyrenochaeta sp. DS3sAY3a]